MIPLDANVSYTLTKPETKFVFFTCSPWWHRICCSKSKTHSAWPGSFVTDLSNSATVLYCQSLRCNRCAVVYNENKHYVLTKIGVTRFLDKLHCHLPLRQNVAVCHIAHCFGCCISRNQLVSSFPRLSSYFKMKFIWGTCFLKFFFEKISDLHNGLVKL